MKMRGVGLGSAALVIGLLVGGIYGGRAIAQQQPPPGSRYQYQCLTKVESRIFQPSAQEELNKMGAQGWRLMENRIINVGGPMSAYQDVYCFERRY